MTQPIYLVGYMGAGKSTVGRKLAERLNMEFIDTDIFLENRFRRRIVDMFAEVGEQSFRKRERYAIEDLSGMENAVIATGGGLPCHSDNMSLLLDTGLVIYLEATDKSLCKRLELCKRTRPSVKDKSGQELLQHIQEAMQTRRPIYEQAHKSYSIEKIKNAQDEWALVEEIIKDIKEDND